MSPFGPLIDAKTGIIRSVELLKLSTRDPAVFVAFADPADTVPICGVPAANLGAACSVLPERAVIRACGESVERYCSAVFDIRGLPVGTEDELGGIRVSDLYPFAGWQYSSPGFPYEPVDGRPIRWVRGQSASGPVWIPASCVYVPYVFDRAVEPFTHMTISTGLAAGPDLASCVRKGLLEILERDALMIVWAARLPAPRIDVESCLGVSGLVDGLLRSVTGVHTRWHLNLLTLDVDVPVISAALIDDGEVPLTSFGISADEDPVRALTLALEEALLTRLLLNRTDLGGELSEVRTLRDHMLVHAASPRLRERLRFLTSDGPVIPFAALDRSSRPVQTRLAEAGFTPAWADITTEDVAEAGLRVARSVIPGMQPLDNDHRHRYLGGDRLLSVPARFGAPGLTVGALNPDPHPFP